MSHRHSLELLAADRGYVVQFCRECDVVHVDVGPVTLRLRPGALAQLGDLLMLATARLHQREPSCDHEPEIDTQRIELQRDVLPN